MYITVELAGTCTCVACCGRRTGSLRKSGDGGTAHRRKTKFCRRRRSKINAFRARGSTICTCRCESAGVCVRTPACVCGCVDAAQSRLRDRPAASSRRSPARVIIFVQSPQQLSPTHVLQAAAPAAATSTDLCTARFRL